MARRRKKRVKPEESPNSDAPVESLENENEDYPEMTPIPLENKKPESAPVQKPQLPEPDPEALEPQIELRVFEKIAGPKWDQLAGFKSYAKRLKLGPLSVREWRRALAEFQEKPVK